MIIFKKLKGLGAGELLINNIDKDGMEKKK